MSLPAWVPVISKILAMLAGAVAIAWPIKKWMWPIAKGMHDFYTQPRTEAERQRERANFWESMDDLRRRLEDAKESSDTHRRAIRALEEDSRATRQEIQQLSRIVDAHGRRITNVENRCDMQHRVTDIDTPEEKAP